MEKNLGRSGKGKTNEINGSKIEIEFVKFLNEYKIRYIREIEFKWLERFRYDFYLIDYDILIELQGIQHYESVEVFGGDEGFKKRKRSDNLKKRKANEYGFTFLQISYKQIENTYQYRIIVLRKILELTKHCVKRIGYRKEIKHYQKN